jgi:hypothetical protein
LINQHNSRTMIQTPEKQPTTKYTADAETYAKRGRADFFSTNFKIAMANANTASPYREKYLKSIICSRELKAESGKITGIYCNQRWCITCNRIRTAKLITKYLGQIERMHEPYFFTLTLKNCKGEDLKERVKFMLKTWGVIQKKFYKKKDTKGFRKLECTHNSKFNDYHPHFHGIINGKSKAETVVKEWIKAISAAGIEIEPQWQDIKPAKSGSEKELMKYTTVLLPKRKKGQTWEDILQKDGAARKHLCSQDIIYRALENVRTFQYFGFTQNIEEEAPENTPEEEKLQTEAQESNLKIPDGTYIRDGRGNWIHIQYNVKLHNRPLSERLINLVNLVGSNYIKPIKV